MRNRAGAALLEALVAASLAAILIGCAALLLQGQSRIARNATARSERSDATRSALFTLRSEMSSLAPIDIHALSGDSIATRIFRGIAVVCGYDAQSSYARYRGLRLPDPAKDSALQIAVENVLAVSSAAPDSSACGNAAGETVLSLPWIAHPVMGSVWLVFESGAYHLDRFALRYRRGTGGRQPITNEVFDHHASSFAPWADSVIRGVDVTLRDRGAATATRMRIPLRNAQ